MTVSLRVTDLDHSHYLRLRMTANVPSGTTLEQVMNPAYWTNHAQRLKPGTLIEVLSEDNALDCELRVLEVGPTYAKVRLLRHYVETADAGIATDLPDNVEISFGGRDKWRVVHEGKIVSSGIATKEAALQAAEEYRGKFAA